MFNLLIRFSKGHPGAEIDAIKDYAEQDLSAKPNLILLLAGTNDVNNGHTDGAPDRLMALVDHLTTSLPEAVVLVGTIPQNGQSDKEVNANTYNDRVTQLLYQRLGDGQRVLPVYMEALASVDGDFADLLHPRYV
jgi:lysophospholipase L1-like esterase